MFPLPEPLELELSLPESLELELELSLPEPPELELELSLPESLELELELSLPEPSPVSKPSHSVNDVHFPSFSLTMSSGPSR